MSGEDALGLVSFPACRFSAEELIVKHCQAMDVVDGPRGVSRASAAEGSTSSRRGEKERIQGREACAENDRSTVGGQEDRARMQRAVHAVPQARERGGLMQSLERIGDVDDQPRGRFVSKGGRGDDQGFSQHVEPSDAICVWRRLWSSAGCRAVGGVEVQANFLAGYLDVCHRHHAVHSRFFCDPSFFRKPLDLRA